MSDELKQGLLLHLQTNRNFVDQKVYKEFGKQCKNQNDISTINRKKMKEVIQFIFDFGSNQEMRPFYQKLQQNIENFITLEKQTKDPNNTGKVSMDLENIVELIIYCVNNGFDKPVPPPKVEQPKKIDKFIQKVPIKISQNVPEKIVEKKKEQPPKKQVPPPLIEEQIKKQQKKKPQITMLNPQLQAKVERMRLVVKPIQPIKAAPKVSTRLEIEKIAPKVEFKLEKHQMPNLTNVGPKYLQAIVSKPKLQQQRQIIRYEPIDPQFAKNENNRRMMRERLQNIFKHYCSQQQNSGQSATFDKIKSELQHMTVGKFMIFCKSSELFSQSNKINKELIMNSFRKIAAGKKEIGFDEFQSLVKELDEKYIEEMKSKGKMNQATYEARLKLNSAQGFKDFKKWLNMVFFTRDKNINDIKQIKTQFQNRDLTSHSGKFEMDLQQELNRIRQSQTIESQKNKAKHSPQKQEKTKSGQKLKAINLQQIHMKEWPKIWWLQEELKKEEIGNSMNQELFPKLSRRKDVVMRLKKRVKELTKLQSNRS